MIKKILSIILTLVLCGIMPLVALAFEDESQADESSVSRTQMESAAMDAVSNVIEDEETDSDVEINLSPEYVYTAEADPEWLEWLYGTPEAVLSGSTSDLLEYFINSSFIWMEAYCSSDIEWSSQSKTDYSCHAAFQELIARDDFLEALENYAACIQNGNTAEDLHEELRLKKILAQPFVEKLVTESRGTSCSIPNLERFYEDISDETARADALTATASTITYSQSGTIKTANNRATWTSIACSGPPCALPADLTPKPEVF